MRPFQLSDILDLYVHEDDRTPVLPPLSEERRAFYAALEAVSTVVRAASRCCICRAPLRSLAASWARYPTCGKEHCRREANHRVSNRGFVEKAAKRVLKHRPAWKKTASEEKRRTPREPANDTETPARREA